MKKILYLSLLFMSAFFYACDDKKSEDVSSVTEYAVITIEGGEQLYVAKGSSYVAKGTSSGGEDVSIKGGDIDTNKCGFYDVEFSATNSDGFDAKYNQSVIVYEEDGVLAGVYDAIRTTKKQGGLVLIYKNAEGTYDCTDIVGGYYEFAKGYGNAYAQKVTSMTLVDGSISATSVGASAFGVWSMTNGVKTGDVLTWKASLPDFGFDVQLTKKTIK